MLFRSPEQIPSLVDGIAAIGELGNCDAVLSGYLGSAAQGRAILSGVARIKAVNPHALYLCDPVMGHPEKGCIVPQEVSDFLLEEAAAMADFLCRFAGVGQMLHNTAFGPRASRLRAIARQSSNDCG